MPVLTRGADHVPLPGDDSDYFTQSRDLIEETFAAITSGDDLPRRLPAEASGGFARFGSSLRAKERIEFGPDRTNPVIYTQRARRELLARQSVSRFPQDGLIAGRVTALDAERQQFTVIDLHGRAVGGSYSDASLRVELQAVLNSVSEAPVVRLEGRLLITSSDEVVSMEDVTGVELFESVDQPWVPRLLDLLRLQPGWLEGSGAAISFVALDFARDLLLEVTKGGQGLPGIFPMEDGGVQLEWSAAAVVTSVEISPDLDVELFTLNAASGDARHARGAQPSEALEWLVEALG